MCYQLSAFRTLSSGCGFYFQIEETEKTEKHLEEETLRNKIKITFMHAVSAWVLFKALLLEST